MIAQTDLEVIAELCILRNGIQSIILTYQKIEPNQIIYLYNQEMTFSKLKQRYGVINVCSIKEKNKYVILCLHQIKIDKNK